MSKFMKSLLSMLLAVIMVASLAVIPSSAATPKLSKTSVTLTKGFYTTLSVSNASGTVKWSTGNKSVATVTSKGKVSGKGPGTTYIYAKVSGKTLKCKVTVVATKITANKSSVILDKKGDTATVTLTVKGSYSIKISNPDQSVAKGSFISNDKVSSSTRKIGVRITAYGAGNTTITIYNPSYPNCYKEIDVTVKEQEPEYNFIMPATTNVSVGLGETYSLRVGAQNQNNLAYTVSNSAVASVTAGTVSGNYRNYSIKGLAAGSTTVRFYDRNNSSNYVDVTVTVASNVKYYEFYTVSPANNKIVYTDQVVEISPTATTKYYMLVPANYDSAYVDTLIAKKFNKYEYYKVYTEIPASRLTATDTYKTFYHTNSKYTYGARYMLVPANYDEVKYNTAVAKYNGRYEYYTIYNEMPTKQDIWDTVDSWNVVDTATSKYITRYMLLPRSYDVNRVNEIKQKDQDANQVYKYYTPYDNYPTVNSNTEKVISYYKNNRLRFMVIPTTTSSIVKVNDAIYKDTGVYEYNVMYSAQPVISNDGTEDYVSFTQDFQTVYILYKITDSNGNPVTRNDVISNAMNKYADGYK